MDQGRGLILIKISLKMIKSSGVDRIANFKITLTNKSVTFVPSASTKD